MCGDKGPMGPTNWDMEILELVKRHAPGLYPRVSELFLENWRNLDKIFVSHDKVVRELTEKIKELNNG